MENYERLEIFEELLNKFDLDNILDGKIEYWSCGEHGCFVGLIRPNNPCMLCGKYREEAINR